MFIYDSTSSRASVLIFLDSEESKARLQRDGVIGKFHEELSAHGKISNAHMEEYDTLLGWTQAGRVK